MANLHQRKCVVAVVVAMSLAALGSAGPTAAQQTAQERANLAAYRAAIKCFVANGKAKNDRRDAGDTAGFSRYEDQAQHAFNTAVLLGTAVGYSNERLNRDLAAAVDRELLLMVRDTAYFRQTVADCRALELM